MTQQLEDKRNIFIQTIDSRDTGITISKYFEKIGNLIPDIDEKKKFILRLYNIINYLKNSRTSNLLSNTDVVYKISIDKDTCLKIDTVYKGTFEDKENNFEFINDKKNKSIDFNLPNETNSMERLREINEFIHKNNDEQTKHIPDIRFFYKYGKFIDNPFFPNYNNTITELINTYDDNSREDLKNQLKADYIFEKMKETIKLVNKVETQMGGEGGNEETKSSELSSGLSDILDEYVRINNNNKKVIFTKEFMKILRLTKDVDTTKRKAINSYVIKLYRFIERVLLGKSINDTVKEHIKSIFIYYCKLFPRYHFDRIKELVKLDGKYSTSNENFNTNKIVKVKFNKETPYAPIFFVLKNNENADSTKVKIYKKRKGNIIIKKFQYNESFNILKQYLNYIVTYKDNETQNDKSLITFLNNINRFLYSFVINNRFSLQENVYSDMMDFFKNIYNQKLLKAINQISEDKKRKIFWYRIIQYYISFSIGNFNKLFYKTYKILKKFVEPKNLIPIIDKPDSYYNIDYKINDIKERIKLENIKFIKNQDLRIDDFIPEDILNQNTDFLTSIFYLISVNNKKFTITNDIDQRFNNDMKLLGFDNSTLDDFKRLPTKSDLIKYNYMNNKNYYDSIMDDIKNVNIRELYMYCGNVNNTILIHNIIYNQLHILLNNIYLSNQQDYEDQSHALNIFNKYDNTYKLTINKILELKQKKFKDYDFMRLHEDDDLKYNLYLYFNYLQGNIVTHNMSVNLYSNVLDNKRDDYIHKYDLTYLPYSSNSVILRDKDDTRTIYNKYYINDYKTIFNNNSLISDKEIERFNEFNIDLI